MTTFECDCCVKCDLCGSQFHDADDEFTWILIGPDGEDLEKVPVIRLEPDIHVCFRCCEGQDGKHFCEELSKVVTKAGAELAALVAERAIRQAGAGSSRGTPQKL